MPSWRTEANGIFPQAMKICWGIQRRGTDSCCEEVERGLGGMHRCFRRWYIELCFLRYANRSLVGSYFICSDFIRHQRTWAIFACAPPESPSICYNIPNAVYAVIIGSSNRRRCIDPPSKRLSASHLSRPFRSFIPTFGWHECLERACIETGRFHGASE